MFLLRSGNDAGPESVGGKAGAPSQVASEVTRMSKAGGGGDVGHGHASVAEQHGSAVKLPPKDIAVWRQADGAVKLTREMERTEAGFGREIVQRWRLVQTGLDASAYPAQLGWRQPPGDRRPRPGTRVVSGDRRPDLRQGPCAGRPTMPVAS